MNIWMTKYSCTTHKASFLEQKFTKKLFTSVTLSWSLVEVLALFEVVPETVVAFCGVRVASFVCISSTFFLQKESNSEIEKL